MIRIPVSKLLILILCISIIISSLCGCNTPESDASSFHALCDDMFTHMVCSDGITLNYTLSNPKDYGITDYTPLLGDYSYEGVSLDYAYYENKLNTLESIEASSLNPEDRLTYDVLYETLSSHMQAAPYRLYEEPLSPVTGIQAELPVLLSEYHFYNEACIKDYFALLKNIPDYFSQIIEFENERKKAGLFMSNTQADEIIRQCRDYIAKPDENMLIQVFPDNIASLNLTPDEISHYVTENEALVRQYVIPGYRYIIDSLTAIKDPAISCIGLGSYPDGKEYYKLLVHNTTGSSKSPEAMYSMLEDTLDECTSNIGKIFSDNPNAYDMLSKVSYPAKTPEDIITYLKEAIKAEYPPLPASAGALNIKYVHPSLENTLSPAMYISPPIDCEVTDDIYINRASCDDSSIFTTLAHEAYPGHLYQSEYYMSTNPHPIRQLLAFGGFVEGWATYTEMYSYSIAGLDPDVATILRHNKLAMLCIYGLIDIGLHYLDWGITDCARLLKENGIDDTSSLKDIYLTVISEPALYLKYIIGCLEFMQIRENESRRLGKNFNPVSFHKSILVTGPVWFDILERNISHTKY